MIIVKKKKGCVFFILLFVTVLSISVLAEEAAFFWYDAGGALCSGTSLGAVPTDPNTMLYGSYSVPAPVNDPTCCDVLGTVQVQFYTTYGRAITIDAYNVNWNPPTGLIYSCGSNGDQVTLSWNSASCASYYSIRVDDTTKGGDENPCTGTTGDYCNEAVYGTSISVSIIPGDSYNWWLHSRDSAGNWGDAVGGPDFICAAPTYHCSRCSVVYAYQWVDFYTTDPNCDPLTNQVTRTCNCSCPSEGLDKTWDPACITACTSAGEVCTTPGDENLNGECDYDSSFCSHGDVVCPVGVTGISVSSTTPPVDSSITVDCTSTVKANSIFASVDGVGDCVWQYWVNGNVARFFCNVGSTTGQKTVRCSVYASKSYQSGSDQIKPITVGVSSCPYTNSTSCDADIKCDWCIECSGVKYGGPNRCVNTGACPAPYCWKGQCGAACDTTNGGCNSSSVCDTTTCSCSPACTPNCVGKCGGASDGCGGYCTASCPSNQTCYNYACCTPNCVGKCGGASNGCGGTCTAPCPSGQVCYNKACCTPKTCSSLGKNCGNWSNDCGGTLSCGSCSSDKNCCNGKCLNETGMCTNKLDDDCDGKVDNLDSDCPGCPVGETVCKDGTCSTDCGTIEPQGCIGSLNGTCDEGEGCACEECEGRRGSCVTTLICDAYYGTCVCPVGTQSCPDGTCKESCGTCNGVSLEPGEECDGAKFSDGLGQCADIDELYSGGTLKCSNCKIDVSSCTQSTADADDDGMPDWWEDQTGLDKEDHDDALLDPDDDGLNNWEEYLRGTNPNKADTDGDLLNDKVDPCPLDPENQCHFCGNNIVELQETCDGTNLDGKTCSSFGFNSGTSTCHPREAENECHFDTSGCFNEVCINKNGKCGEGEGCACPDCVGGQSKDCGNNAVCDETGGCKCEDGTTLCSDGSCSKTCATLPSCNGISGCESGEGCSCSDGAGCINIVGGVGECKDCAGETDTCMSSSTCINGKCVACSILKAYWTEDCIGSGILKGVSMIVEGTDGCKGRTVTLDLKEQDDWGEATYGAPDNLGEDDVDVEVPSATFDDKGKAELKWAPKWFEEGTSPNDCSLLGCTVGSDAKKSSDNPPENFLEYYFVAEVGKEVFKSGILKVHYCDYSCDKDCDTYVDNGYEGKCSPGSSYGQSKGGVLIIDSNPYSGYCEDCTPDGLSPGQETCAAYYDCTPDWSGVIKSELEWGECGEGKGAGADRETVTSELMRNRLVCLPSYTKEQCCNETVQGGGMTAQANCYCKVPSQDILDKYGCGINFRPTEIKACLLEEKFPFFTNMNILITVLILTGFYIWQTNFRTKRKK